MVIHAAVEGVQTIVYSWHGVVMRQNDVQDHTCLKGKQSGPNSIPRINYQVSMRDVITQSNFYLLKTFSHISFY